MKLQLLAITLMATVILPLHAAEWGHNANKISTGQVALKDKDGNTINFESNTKAESVLSTVPSVLIEGESSTVDYSLPFAFELSDGTVYLYEEGLDRAVTLNMNSVEFNEKYNATPTYYSRMDRAFAYSNLDGKIDVIGTCGSDTNHKCEISCMGDTIGYTHVVEELQKHEISLHNGTYGTISGQCLSVHADHEVKITATIEASNSLQYPHPLFISDSVILETMNGDKVATYTEVEETDITQPAVDMSVNIQLDASSNINVLQHHHEGFNKTLTLENNNGEKRALMTSVSGETITIPNGFGMTLNRYEGYAADTGYAAQNDNGDIYLITDTYVIKLVDEASHYLVSTYNNISEK